MNKRLNKKSRPAAPPVSHRTARLDRPRPNRYQTFLKRLRAGGRSNMYGAIPYLMEAFALDRVEAFRIVCEWVDAQHAEENPWAVPAPRQGRPAGATVHAGGRSRLPGHSAPQS